jgi:CMP-N-acetylneuraminic acid synthetase
MKAICVIPARGGSKGIPKKNIRLLGTKPLIAYAIESALNSEIFDTVIVSTDDQEIAKISKQFGAEIPFERPSHLANDVASNDAVLLHAIKKMESLGKKYEISFLRDCTVPFLDEDDLHGVFDLLTSSDCNAVFGAVKAHPNPYFGMMEVNSSGFLNMSKSLGQIISRRQDAPTVYNIEGVFAHFVKPLEKTGNILTSKILPYEISKLHGHMIDFKIDFETAEFLLQKKV